MFVTVGVVSLLIPIYLALLNRQHAKRREEMGKAAVRVDESMLEKADMALGKGVEVEEGGSRQGQETDNGFSDLTDMQNEDFIYVY
jgi:hypothetical protein